MPEVFLSSVTLQPLPYILPNNKAFDIILDSGFSGVEILLTRHVANNLTKTLLAATDHGLDIALHRWWPPGEGWWNKFITPFLFPKANSVKEVLQYGNHLPVVISSYERYSMDEYFDLPDTAVFQPTPTGPEVVPFPELKEWMKRNKVRIVFDVGHWMQYLYRGARVPTNPRKVLATLVREFYEFKDQIKEVHLYDVETYSPSGMNKFPERGYSMLKKFLLFLRDIHWEGRIVWEISPFEVFPNKFDRLQKLPRFVREVFD